MQEQFRYSVQLESQIEDRHVGWDPNWMCFKQSSWWKGEINFVETVSIGIEVEQQKNS